MRIFAIDPGRFESAWLIYDTETKKPESFGISRNDSFLQVLQLRGNRQDELLAIEMIASYGMPVGKTVFDTCVWIGRFIQAWSGKYKQIYRRDVKMYLCNSMRAKDGNVRQAIIERFEPLGGGATPQIGTKAQPGPLYGISKDVWAALGVAITAAWTGEAG
jgi:hypothetical protein